MDNLKISNITMSKPRVEKQTHMYDVMLPKARKGISIKAIIAARFEDSLQKFIRLCTLIGPSFPDDQSKSLVDCLGAFITWGNESGAKDQTLDHRLRKSKELYDMVVLLLVQLQEALDDGLQILQSDSLQLAKSKALQGDADIVPFQGDAEIASDDLPSDHAILSSEAEDREQAMFLFEIIQDTVENLKSLAPSLARPYPDDLDTLSSSVSTSSENTDQADVELARKMFPSASKILQTRLGHANWKRKLAQKAIQLQSKQWSGLRRRGDKGHKKSARQEVAQDAFNFQRPYLKDMAKTLNTIPSQTSFQIQPTAPSTAPSDTASIFSKSKSVAETINTMTTYSTRPPPPKSPRPKQSRRDSPPTPSLVVAYPKVPIQLENRPDGKSELFTCNLCGYDLEAGNNIKTEEDWKQHVLRDLEPYLCTFDDCFSAQEMYAIRDQWYKHELETHRIKKVWVCAACREEFATKALAEKHVENHAGEDFDEDDIVMMKSMLRQGLSQRPLATTPCPLCLDRLHPNETKMHISGHLEDLALMSVIETSSEEDESDELISLTNDDDNMSDRGIRETVLKNFVSEQLKLNLERGTKPPDRYLDGGIDLLEDMSDYDGSNSDEESHVGRIGKTGTSLLMERMFHGEQEKTTGRRTGPRKTSWDRLGGGPASQASSNEKLPLLRTYSYPRNEDFTGRDKDLANLYKILSEPGRVCVVHGDGGMGKTALAVEFSWRYEHCYHYVFWIQAETPVGSTDTFCQIALQLNLAPEGADNDTLIRAGREFLETSKDKRWLLIFDNVDNWTDIDQYVPTKTSATNGAILITTRHENLTAPSRPVNYFRLTLEELDMDEGRKLLLHFLPPDLRPEENSLRDPEYKIAGEIAALAGRPLLIIYISGYVRRANCTLSEFWEYWEEWRPRARASGGDGGQESVFQIAFRDLSGDARKIARIMAFLDSDEIQPELLMRMDNNKPGPAYLRQSRFRTLISNLVAQKFVMEWKSKTDGKLKYSIHRVLQSRLLQDMHEKRHERDEIFRTAYELVRYHLPRPSLGPPEPRQWSAFKEYLPHVLSLQRAYAGPLSITTPTPFVGLAELFKDGGVLLWQRYIHDDALKLLKSAEKILDELGCEEDDLRVEINITINLLLQYFGISHRQESKERFGRILEYRKKFMTEKPVEERTREERLQLTEAYADYANALLQFNDYKTAEPIYHNCYKKYLELVSSEEDDVFAFAKLNHHMAYCAMYRRDFPTAIKLAEKAVALIDKLGERQLTLRYQFDQACIVLQSGDLNKALALHREILEQRLGLQGRASYFSLQSQYAYAAMCHYVGRHDEAIRWMKQALAKADSKGGKNFWPEAAVARTKYHLSLVMREKNNGKDTPESETLSYAGKDVLSKMLPYDPAPINGVAEEDTVALFDHLQPAFGGRFTGVSLLKYVSPTTTED